MLANQQLKIVLASKSPRRQQLLREAGINFRLFTKEVEETYPADLPSHQVAEFLARKKGNAIIDHVEADEIAITADTIVLLGQEIMGKPKDEAQAFDFISRLSDTVHEVITGIALQTPLKQHSFSVSTKVFFRKLSDEEIRFYIEQYKPYDKAGSYAIQEWIGMVGIYKIEGCYFNVMGLPLFELYKELQAFIR